MGGLLRTAKLLIMCECDCLRCMEQARGIVLCCVCVSLLLSQAFVFSAKKASIQCRDDTCDITASDGRCSTWTLPSALCKWTPLLFMTPLLSRI